MRFIGPKENRKCSVLVVHQSHQGKKFKIKISMTICVSTAECERLFSALKRIKTHLRTTINEERLTDLAVLSIKRELSKKIDLEKVITNFAKEDKNRRIMLL